MTKDCCKEFVGVCPDCAIKMLPDPEELFNTGDA